jgi:hypothetical protein
MSLREDGRPLGIPTSGQFKGLQFWKIVEDVITFVIRIKEREVRR